MPRKPQGKTARDKPMQLRLTEEEVEKIKKVCEDLSEEVGIPIYPATWARARVLEAVEAALKKKRKRR